MIQYKFYYFGPYLYKAKMNENEIKQIKEICLKDKSKQSNEYLAGLIKEEYTINKNKLFSVIEPYIQSYKRTIHQHWNLKINGKLVLNKKPWVNFMTKFESNPMHSHDCDVSFVIYLQIPDSLKKEYKNNISNNSGPGVINFMNKLNKENLSINTQAFFPEVGDIFIFPANLVHFVNSFTSNGERISVSGNLDIVNEKNSNK